LKGPYVSIGERIKPEQVVLRIPQVFDGEFDVKVIIFIRKQSDWITSVFAEWHQYCSKINDYNSHDKFASCFKDVNCGFAQDINYENVVMPFDKISRY